MNPCEPTMNRVWRDCESITIKSRHAAKRDGSLQML